MIKFNVWRKEGGEGWRRSRGRERRTGKRIGMNVTKDGGRMKSVRKSGKEEERNEY
ncbi:hypothetical protein ANN_13817 [Periplaneta americana]|uniref:Uncharacterized protein n=1 Tax=Periplaneta americana TaxID=6978 RepID=A0ABQ8SUK3_PERAM|nr:hypothetical protein ANN_13817 [Periplaneta americana]